MERKFSTPEELVKFIFVECNGLKEEQYYYDKDNSILNFYERSVEEEESEYSSQYRATTTRTVTHTYKIASLHEKVEKLYLRYIAYANILLNKHFKEERFRNVIIRDIEVDTNNCEELENTDIIKLELINCKIEELEYLPNSLEYLDLSDNNLKKLGTLPKELSYLNISDNRNFEDVPYLPENLIYFIFNGTKIDNLQNIPRKLKQVQYAGTPLQKLQPNHKGITYKQSNAEIKRWYKEIQDFKKSYPGAVKAIKNRKKT